MEDRIAAISSMIPQLHISEKSAVSLSKTEPDYVLHLDAQSCSRSDAKLAATSSNNAVQLYSRHNLANVMKITGHQGIVAGVRFSPVSDTAIYTCCVDGKVCGWDFRSKPISPSITFHAYGNEPVLSAFDVNCSGRVLCAGTDKNEDGDACLIFWDVRKAEPFRTYSESHQDDITQVKFHRDQQDTLLSGSTDGLLNVLDTSQEDEDEALLTTLNSESSVSCVGWCGDNNSQIYCITHIETLHMWTADEYDTLLELTDIKECTAGSGALDYVVDCFTVPGSSTVHVLAGDNSGKGHMMSIQDNSLSHQFTLDEGHTDTIRCMTYDPTSGTLVTGGEDSMLCLWSPQEASSYKAHRDKWKEKGSAKLKSKKKKSVHAGSKPF